MKKSYLMLAGLAVLMVAFVGLNAYADKDSDGQKVELPDAVKAAVEALYPGAEIEEAVVSAMFDTFYENKLLKTENILDSIAQTVPLSKTMSEDMDHLRDWAQGRTRLATSPAILSDPDSDKRKLEL